MTPASRTGRPDGSNRPAGSPFDADERALLAMLCSGAGPQSGALAQQVAAASWGGRGYDDCDCFLVNVDKTSSPAPIEHDGGPFSLLEVSTGEETVGLVELWVVDGFLHSVDYVPFGEQHRELPTERDFEITRIE